MKYSPKPLSPYEPLWFPSPRLKLSVLEKFLTIPENQGLRLSGLVVNKMLAIRVDRIR